MTVNGVDGEIMLVSKNKLEMGSMDDEVVIVGKTKTTVTGDELTLQGGSKAKLESGDTDIV